MGIMMELFIMELWQIPSNHYQQKANKTQQSKVQSKIQQNPLNLIITPQIPRSHGRIIFRAIASERQLQGGFLFVDQRYVDTKSN